MIVLEHTKNARLGVDEIKFMNENKFIFFKNYDWVNREVTRTS